MGQYGYRLPNGAEIVVTASTLEEGKRKLQIEHDRLLNPTLGQRGRGVMGLINQGITSKWSDELGASGAAAQGWEDGKPMGATYRDSLNSQRNDIAERRAAHPYISQGIETTAAMLPAIATMGASVAAPSLLRAATTGSLWGGANAAGGNEAVDPDDPLRMVQDLAIDTTKGGLTGAVTGAGVTRVLNGPGPPRIDAPRVAGDLRRTAGDTYEDLLEQNPPVPDFANHALRIFDQAERQGIGRVGDPAMWQRLQNIRTKIATAAREGREVSYRDVDDLIEGLKATAKSPNVTQKALAQNMVRDLYEALPENARALREGADDMYRRGSRSEAVTNATADASRAAGRSGVGGNTINAQRQAIDKLIRENRKTGYFTDAELEMMTEFVEGGSLENFMRRVGGLSPLRSTVVPLMFGSNMLNQMGLPGTKFSLGATGLATAGAVAGLAGQKTAEAMQRSSMRDLQRLILTGQAPARVARATVRGANALAGQAGGAAGATDTQSYYQSLLDLIGQGDEKDGR